MQAGQVDAPKQPALFLRVQHLQNGGAFGIRRAIKPRWAVVHLKGGQHVARCNVQLAGLWGLIAQLGHLLLKPGDTRQSSHKQGLLTGDSLGVWPNPKTCLGKALPREQWARIKFAQRCNVAVTNDVVRVYFVAG